MIDDDPALFLTPFFSAAEDEERMSVMKREQKGLYRSEFEHDARLGTIFEHDACGIGAVVNSCGKRSHETVANALRIVENLAHRAGKDADGTTGDGVGILLQICHRFFCRVCRPLGISLGEAGSYGVAMLFLPQDALKCKQAQKLFEVIVAREGMRFLGWRVVPVAPEVLSARARDCMPQILQAFVEKPEGVQPGLDFERRLYVARRIFEESSDGSYVVSMSSRTIVYKGMFLVGQLRAFFDDLRDACYESAIALVHSRFSTNTNPSWARAHPNRLMVHNGEINTIRGNADKMLAREETMASPFFAGELHRILPVVDAGGSDSAMLDNTLEFLMMSGMPLPLAVMITIPEPWANNPALGQEVRDFYQYYATMMEPWDGPASIVFSDGELVGAVLDRNGLRPSRYYVLKNGDVVLASEVGVLQIPETEIMRKARIHPGKMLLIDTVRGEILDDAQVKARYMGNVFAEDGEGALGEMTALPYGEWLDANLLHLSSLKIPNRRVPGFSAEALALQQKAFAYTDEEVHEAIVQMALTGEDPTASMGDDTPLAVLSTKHPPFFNYFRQRFAQVTNPPFDAIREEIVTSTSVYVGRRGNILAQRPENCQVLKVENPILTNTDMLKIKHMQVPGFKVAVVSILYYRSANLARAIRRLYVEVDRAYAEGANILVLSDRGVDEIHVAMPSLLAVAAVHQHLVETGKQTQISLILESGEPRLVHHFATLLGYGAVAVNPYLALESIHALIAEGALEKDYYAAEQDYTAAILHGIVKIAAKMGITTLQSYQGAKLFEALGISQRVIDDYFAGTVSRIGGITLEDIANACEARHACAFDPLGRTVDPALERMGWHKRQRGGEEHRFDPETIRLLQKATREGDYDIFKQYSARADDTRSGYLRSLLDFDESAATVPLEEVEPVDNIVRRFKTGAMSYGSISQEAHEALAIAMNRLHGLSNSGEGGESEERLDDPERCSAIKQVASARFGVTSRYLVSARELQIKMAQGAKPGEGGHLPARKVYPWIARTRHATPGVTLISPPPHHDIYSIEDLAELIYDLKNANKYARISVKLVAEAGVGTVACGVAKAGAEVILISGYDGGTGAAPENAIHHAGLPWELGLAETHQTLLQNGLRARVRLETDGKLMTGRDVAIAALLGAEEFGFATAPLVTLGCVMMRVCHLDTCPVGVATQNPELRKRFRGKPEYVEHFMRFVAEELREIMARLGFRSVDEMVGRSDRLRLKPQAADTAAARVDLSPLLAAGGNVIFDPAKAYNFHLEQTLDARVLLKRFKTAIISGRKAECSVRVGNRDRAFGTLLGAAITRAHSQGLSEDTITVHCTGSGGQSFGAFIPAGLTLVLSGDSNDYFGKGLSGGKLILRPPADAGYAAEDNIICGNVALYGATGGKVFICGQAGERFAVRNSGAWAVVEGVGEHGCEYMTGGRVVVLGETGKNFAAGMSGGVAYVLDSQSRLYRHLNKEMVLIEKPESTFDIAELRGLIEEHAAATGSALAQRILEDFDAWLPRFKKIIPKDYKRMTALAERLEDRGMSSQQAQIEAFYESFRQDCE